MEFSIVAESGIIEEACKTTNHPAACFPVLKFLSASSSLPGFFKFLTVSDNHPLLTASDLNLGLVRFELGFPTKYYALQSPLRLLNLKEALEDLNPSDLHNNNVILIHK